MAASPRKVDRKQPSNKQGHPPTPESSLTWCLAHLYKPGTGPEDQGVEMDKRSRTAQWRALVAIRTQHIKGGKAGIARFRTQGGLRPLLNVLKHPECSRKTLDLALSILANCCTEQETRVEVCKLDGITIVVDVMRRNASVETVRNRAARALGNLAMDPENSALIHSAGGVPLLLLCVSLSSSSSSPTSNPMEDSCPKVECAQSAARALLYLSDTPPNRLSLLTQGTISALAPLIAPEYPQGLRRAALRTLHELTRGCGVECAREVSRSGILAQLGVMASGESGKPFEELALKTLANMCSQGCLRPLVGSLGVIQRFTEEVKRDPAKSGVFLKALCLCCKEAVNRAKVKESGGLEVLIAFLSSHQSHPLSRLAILACVDFVYDEAAMEQLQELGLVPLLVSRLVELTRGGEQWAEKTDVGLNPSMSPTELLSSAGYDSFDFPPPDGFKKEEASREHGSPSFLSLRSWLVSEGLISSEGDLLDCPSGAEGDWGGLHIPPPSSSSSPQMPSPNPSTSSSSSSSSSKSVSQPSPAPSSSLVKSLDPPPPPPVPHASSSSTVSSPTLSQTPQAQVSPTKFSSPHRKRQRVHSPAVSLSKVTLDAPPSAPRPPAYHHPYHPEPWTAESPILLLLSRFSHAPDPSAALVTPEVMGGLLLYLTQHQDPSSRCFRLLCRLSCNPNSLQALVRTGAVALIRHRLCQRGGEQEEEERQTDRVKAKVRQLGVALLNNLRVLCESGFGSGVLAHVMLSGSDADKLNCTLSLPFINSNKALLKKLLLDSGGLLLALQPLGCEEDVDEDHPAESGKLLSDWFNSQRLGQTSQLRSLYFALLAACLSSLTGGRKTETEKKNLNLFNQTSRCSPPPPKKPRVTDSCPYCSSDFDLLFLLDDGSQVPANRACVVGTKGTEGTEGTVGSEYFRALLTGGFGEAQDGAGKHIQIRDVSSGMLLPVLHHLHGCRLPGDTGTDQSNEGQTRGRCQVLESLVFEGLDVRGASEEPAFQRSPLGEMMIGASRFLVAELQGQLEDVCVSLLLSVSAKAASGAAEDNVDECAEENLASRTSELELSGCEVQTEQCVKKKPSGAGKKVCRGPGTTVDQKTITKITPGSKPSCESVTDASDETRFGPEESPASSGDALAALLLQVYWFSQRYSFPSLGRSCLSVLLGGRDRRRPALSWSAAGDCLRRMAREADCAQTLKQDLLHLATAALS